MKQIQAGEKFKFLGIELIPEINKSESLSCEGCYFSRMICGQMSCMVSSFACHPEDNDLGQDLIIKKVK